jgi:SSS family transporter
VFRIRYFNGSATFTTLPRLPRPCANLCGAIVDNVLYIAGGIETPDATVASSAFWALDLSRASNSQRWEELPTWPGRPRILAVAAARDKAFYLFSGVDLSAGADGKPVRTYLTDAYRYQRESGWRRIADLPRPAAAAPSPAASTGAAHVLILGGDDGAHVGFQPPENHPGFATDVLAYHVVTNTWSNADKTPSPLVTTPLVAWQNGFVVPGGEIRPGIRSTTVSLATPVPRRAAFGVINLLALGIYPAIMLAIGFHFARKKRSANDFFRGGQRIPAWAAGLSIYATMLSSITFMAIPAKAYATDWGFFLNYFSILLLAPLVIAVYLPFFRQLDVVSAYEYLELRFNLAVRLLGCASFIVFQIIRTGIVLYLPALALSTVSSLNIDACIIGMAMLTILLTVFGGMEAVVWTDVAQAIILLAAAALSLGIIVPNLQGGLSGLISTAKADGKFFSNVPWNWDLTIATGWVIFFGQLFTNLISYTSNQEVVQRYLTTRDERRAGRAIWINAWVSLPSGILFFAVGTALYVFYKQHASSLDPSLAQTDAIFPYFMVHEMPPGVAGFVVAGIFAAAQPTSGLNSAATAFVTDFYRRFKPAANDAAAVRAGRIATIVTGVLGAAVALATARYRVESLWELFLNVLGLTTGTLAGLFALGMLTRRANGTGAVLGLLVTGVALWFIARQTNVYPLLYGAASVITCVISGYVLSFLNLKSHKPLEGLTVFTRRTT